MDVSLFTMGTLRGTARLGAAAMVIEPLGCSQRPKDEEAPVAFPEAAAAALVAASVDGDVNPRLLRPFQALPTSFDDDKNARTAENINLGRTLFVDPRLSADGDLSCNSCHSLDDYGVDHPRSRYRRELRSRPLP